VGGGALELRLGGLAPPQAQHWLRLS